MIARARRAFPGMVVSMLLAGPAFAGTQAVDDATIQPRKRAGFAAAWQRPRCRIAVRHRIEIPFYMGLLCKAVPAHIDLPSGCGFAAAHGWHATHPRFQ